MPSITSSIQRHIDQLSTVIGSRPSWSPANRLAEEYIAGEMRRLGMQVERQEFPNPAWTLKEFRMTMAGREVEVLVNPFSPPCDIEAGLAPACTLAELETVDLTGKIALLYGDLTRQPIAAKNWFLKEDRDIRIYDLLEQKKPLAVLTVQVVPGSVNRLIEDQEFLLPSATLPNECALFVFNHLNQPCRLRIKSRMEPGEAANLVARIPGRRPQVVVMCAHFDTKMDTPGAGDNAAGVAALLGLAEHYAGSSPEVGLEFIAFNNEEYLPIGDDAYLTKVGEEHLKEILVAVNFDGLGHILASNTLAIFTHSEEFKTAVEEVKLGYPAVEWVEPWPQSNHSTFSWRGVPALAFSSQGLIPYCHQRFDSAEWVSAARVEEAVRLTADIIERIVDSPLEWLRPGNLTPALP
ncbi:MAG: M28 family peptidase [Anaerolineaceae bacterium]